jgi:hypothetical protein
MRISGVTAALDLLALAWIREIPQNFMQACVLPDKSYEEQAISMIIDPLWRLDLSVHDLDKRKQPPAMLSPMEG